MQLFDFTDYRKFLSKHFSGSGETRGKRKNLANYLNCQVSFLTQVFSERAHLSLEYSIKTAQYLNLNKVESDYFMLLVQKGKAGSRELESYFDGKLKSILKERELINSRIQIQTELSLEDQMRYYSVWHYSAIHILSAIPGYHTVETISDKLKLDILIVKDSLEFLVEKGFVKFIDGLYQIGKTRIHLNQGSPMLPRHHANWRMKAIESVDKEKERDLHYTGILGISKNDMKIFRERFLKLLEDFEPIISQSKEDSQVIILIDLFET